MVEKKPILSFPFGAKPIDYSKTMLITPKLGGFRCVKPWDDLGGITAYSRTGKECKNIQHILEQLVPFFEKYPNVILDGELYNHDFKDNF